MLSVEYGGLGLGRIQSRSHVFYHPALEKGISLHGGEGGGRGDGVKTPIRESSA